MSISQINLLLLQCDFWYHLITATITQLGQASFQLLTTFVRYYFLDSIHLSGNPRLVLLLGQGNIFLSGAYKPISMVVNMCEPRWEAEA